MGGHGVADGKGHCARPRKDLLRDAGSALSEFRDDLRP